MLLITLRPPGDPLHPELAQLAAPVLSSIYPLAPYRRTRLRDACALAESVASPAAVPQRIADAARLAAELAESTLLEPIGYDSEPWYDERKALLCPDLPVWLIDAIVDELHCHDITPCVPVGAHIIPVI